MNTFQIVTFQWSSFIKNIVSCQNKFKGIFVISAGERRSVYPAFRVGWAFWLLFKFFQKAVQKKEGFLSECALKSLAPVLSGAVKAGAGCALGCKAVFSIPSEIQWWWDPMARCVWDRHRSQSGSWGRGSSWHRWLLPLEEGTSHGCSGWEWGSFPCFAEHHLQPQASSQCTKQNCSRYL